LVVAWYHGEKGRQRVSGPELLMVAGILAVAGAAIALVGSEGTDGAGVLPVTDETSASGEGGASVKAADPATSADSVPSRSVGVLPLDDHSPDPGDAYFAPAMTEAITNALQKIPDLHVSARNSAEQFTDSGMTVREFAVGELGVAHAIEGSVQIQGDRAHVTVQLIDAQTGGHLWSETYEEALADVVDVQVRIARAVAEQLAAAFTDRAEERIRAGSTEDPEALELYLEAMAIDTETPEDLDREIALLREAVARDPGFSLASGALAELFYRKQTVTRDERFTDSLAAYIQQAIDSADHPSIEARHRILRDIYFGDDIGAVVRLLRQSYRTNPSDPWINWALGATYALAGDLSEAVRWHRRTISIDPLRPDYRFTLGRIYMMLGLDSVARRAMEEGRELADEPGGGLWLKFQYHLLRNELDVAMSYVDSLRALGDPYVVVGEGAVHLRRGELDSARKILERVDEQPLALRQWSEAPMVAHVMLSTGDTARAEALLRQAEDVPGAPLDIFTGSELEMKIAAVRGDAEAATEALRRLTEEGGRSARWYRESPIYSRVRDDPEFQAALAEQEQLIARERREVERMLAEDEAGVGGRE
ncbi:MAG: hypothetical protein ACODAA_07285, partial [Gemmatimonadota bacterium]